MSRIGNAPITVPGGVDVAVDGTAVTVKGPKGTLIAHLPRPGRGSTLDDGILTVPASTTTVSRRRCTA